MSRKFLNTLRENLIVKVYSKYNLVDENKLAENTENLLTHIQYLPYLVRVYLGNEYTKRIYQNRTIYRKVREDNKKSIKDKSIEFINWTNKHQEYKNLLNKQEKKLLDKELQEIEQEINYIKDKINQN